MYKCICFICVICFYVAASFASIVVEDSKSKFVIKDEVLDSSVYPCTDDFGKTKEGFNFFPENAFFKNNNGVPFRLYRIAIPTNASPIVSVTDVKRIPLNKSFCKDISLTFESTSVSKPYFKDGLWIVDVHVPLYEKNGNSVFLRKSFKLSVQFKEFFSGVNPGSRAISRVMNKNAAKNFGVSNALKRKSLRKSALSEISNVHFLAQFLVGDKNISTNSEDALYAVSFNDISIALQNQNRKSDIYGIPVEKIRIYTAHPDSLTEMVPSSDKLIPNQLFEIPIEVRDHSPSSSVANGIFDEGDSIIFVGFGKSIWKRCDSEDSSFVNGSMDYYHSVSPYSYYQYFNLVWTESGSGLRMNNYLKTPSIQGKNINWLRYVRAEKDVFLRDTYFGKNLDYESATGKEWFWFWHSKLDTTFISNIDLEMPQTKNLPGLIEGGKQYVSASFMPHRSTWSTTVDRKSDQTQELAYSSLPYSSRMSKIRFDFSVNGDKQKESSMTLIPGGNFRLDNVKLKLKDNKFELTMLPNILQFDRFDGYSIAYEWTPSVDSSEWFLPGKVSGVINIPMTPNTQVMKFENFKPLGLLEVKNGFAKDSVSINKDTRYLVYKTNKFKSVAKVIGLPLNANGILNNLSKINSETEYLIITADYFAKEAIALGSFRSDGSALTKIPTTVVSAENIYKMYTGGNISPIAIRNYIAYAYSVCPSLKYVLLVGSGHYDYKNIVVSSMNFIPPYEIEDAIIEDFFGVLDSGETVRFGSYDVDVSIGRLPVVSSREMLDYITKAKDYDQIGKFDHGVWRSNVLLTADDAMNGTTHDDTKHTLFEEDIAEILDELSISLNFRWNIKKIYLVDYTYDAAGQKKEAASDFMNVLNQGALVTNYFGHGSKTDWAAEGLFKVSYIPNLSNKGRYTILNSFSCTVARFDEGKGRSLSEATLIAPNAGSIASVGATRETLGPQNREFGKTLMTFALGESGITYGDAFKKTKNQYSKDYSMQRYNNERYIYIGEPVIHMPIAENQVKLDQKIDTLKALDKMILSGSVSGIKEGKINLSIREGRVTKRLGLNVFKPSGIEDSLDVIYEGSLLYSEEVPIKNGRFETDFVTPRKINFGDTAAEFSAWAFSEKDKGIARLLKSNIKISGMSNYADSLHDEKAPTIKIQSCYSSGISSSFANGQHVKLQSPACLQILIEDSTAIDYREQADEGISFEIVGVEDSYHPYPYLEQTSKRALLRKTFSAQAYPEGEYVFKVYASDVLGNTTIQTLFLEITGELEEGLSDVFNIPNPMGKKGTVFYFKNLAVDRTSKVNIFIYNQNGRLVKVIKNAISGKTHWDGRDNHGRLLANGLYHYVVRNDVDATSVSKKSTWTKKQKLLISR